MEENKNIDDIFKSALDDLKMMPSEASWDAISSGLSAKRTARLRNRKKRILWFSTAVLLLLTSYTSFHFINQPEKNPVPGNVVREKVSSSQASTKAFENKKTASNNPSHQTVNSNNDSRVADQPSTDYAPIGITTKPAGKLEESVISETVNNSTIDTESDAVFAAIIPVAPSSTDATVNNVQQSQNIKASTISTDKDQSQIEINNQQSTENTVNINPADKVPTQREKNVTEVTVVETAAVVSTTTPAEQHSIVQTSPVSEESSGSTVEVAPPAIDLKQSENAQAVNPESSTSLLKRVLSHLAVDIYYTPEYVQSTLKVDNTYNGPASKNLDDYQNEKSQYSYSAGINLRYGIGSRWSIASGISVSSYSKSSVYNTISVVADSVYQEVYVNRPWSHRPGGRPPGGGHPGGGQHGGGPHGGGHGHQNPHHPNNPNNNHHYVIHTPHGSIDLNNVPPRAASSNSGDTLKVKTEVFETVNFINVPLLVRYTFGTKKLSYFVEGGAALNYVTNEKVQVVINDATIEDNSLDALSNMNYSILFGFGTQYNFYKGLSMFVKPSLRYSVTPVNIDSPVKSYPYYLGMGAGLTIEF